MFVIEITQDLVFNILKKRTPDSNKGTYGTLLSVCGSESYRGAAVLSSLSALRSGVGILRLAAVETVAAAVAATLPEVTFEVQKTGKNGEIYGFDFKRSLEKYPRTTACLIGCGLGLWNETSRIVKDIISSSSIPLLLDADALNSIADNPEILKTAKAEILITPHVGEFSRLSGKEICDIKTRPCECALDFAKKYGVTVLLKDSESIVAVPNGEIYINHYGTPGQARGGSGDFLSGIAASLLAQGYSPKNSAICACALSGMAAQRCAKRLSMQGMLIHDAAYDLCQIFLENRR